MPPPRPYEDRHVAGRALADALDAYRGRRDVVVLALPRGGVPVGYEVARALEAPLDVFLVRKLGVPGHRELAMGAIASGGVRVLNDDVVGGATEFADADRVLPEAGKALFFDHHVLHQGAPVREGLKYVLRTDVMYRAP